MTKQEIKGIDSRIKDFQIELPCEDCSTYYVKIWFDYEMNGRIETDGRTEFEADTKEQLIEQIKDFMNSDKGFWKIL